MHQFQRTAFSSPQALFQRLTAGQHREALFITCSDSRINFNLVTYTKPGDLFIIRVADNIMPTHRDANGGEWATLEYAVTALGIRDIIVCGQPMHCRAMHGLLHLK